MRRIRKLFAFCIAATLSWHCQYIFDFTGNDDVAHPSHYEPVIITDIHPDSLQLDAFALDSAAIQGNILTLTVSYSGGCAEHEFALYMSPSVFMESNPVQANLYLWHNANGDLCEAYLNKKISFDISKIADNYRNAYHSRAGVVRLNIYEYYEDEPGMRIQVGYAFR